MWPTLGIYHLVWWYKIHAEMAEFDRRRKIGPGGAVWALIFGWLIVPMIVTYLNGGRRIARAQRAAGLTPTCSAGLGTFLMFVFGAGIFYYQSELNKVIDRYGDVQPGTQLPLYV